ncbi:MAG: T9SS type A sorting domain-containing protein [Saprospiraceae bacterium]|nr:T9SS type A sorting domain-containing protein [Candidatus Opimibacter iunctus]
MNQHLPASANPFTRLPISLFRLFGLFCLFSLFSLFSLNAQTCQDASVELSAVVQSNPARITLNWVANAGATNHYVYRKLKTGSSWGALLATLPGTATQFIDSTVNTGVSYEYRVNRQAANYTGFGYINAGIEVPAVQSRGIIILVVDATFVDSLAFEIDRLKQDLEGDGWRVVQHTVARNASVTAVKALIVGTYNQDKVNTKAVFLLGRIKVPYSGDLNPDGHPDHEGAWPADVYYADMNGTWTDNAVNVTVATDERHRNIPEDGKFDQTQIPTDVELQIGRVDFANMPSFAASELQLLRNYLDKDHAYRHKLFTPVHRGVVDDNFGYFSREAFASSGWKNIGPLVGPDKVIADDYFTAMRDSSYLWSYGCGGGWYQGAGGVGSTGDFANSNLHGVFSMLFGSYFGDWDSADNFLRAPLAQGTTLTNAWSGRPHWLLHHMGLGETIGYSTRLTQNNNSLYFFSYGARFIHIALMGDPTLRNDVVAPVSDVAVIQDGLNHLLTWTPSPDPVLGYNIYVRTLSSPGYVLLNAEPLQAITYSNDCVDDEGLMTYMVRAVALQQSPSGTYYNLSQGITDTITNHGIPEVHADATWVITDSQVFFTNLSVNATSYIWGFGDGIVSSEASPNHAYDDGFYHGVLISSNGCKTDTLYFDVLIFTAVSDIQDDPSIIVSPNPSNGKFIIQWDKGMADAVNLEVYALTGKAVFGKDGVVNGSAIDLSALPAGIYVMHIVRDGVRSMKRVVIQY